MHLKTRNVNTAFRTLVGGFAGGIHGVEEFDSVDVVRSTSRNGDVLCIPEPVIVTYTHPRERVLFNQARDANPFFHLYESLYMLAGRRDIAPLSYYSSKYPEFVQDGDNPNANGAYGYRWRHNRRLIYCPSQDMLRASPNQGSDYRIVSTDQLKTIIDHLKYKPDSRRCVLQVWNVEDDLLKIDTSKDVCCNTHAYFSLRSVWDWDIEKANHLYLDMTVCNRSNDLILGMLGANVVHFSILQEYMAACIGVEVGVYNQITNNCHVYTNPKQWKPEEWLADPAPDFYQRADISSLPPSLQAQLWGKLLTRFFPLVKDPATFDREVAEFVERHGKDAVAKTYTEPFLDQVAQPMCIAFHHHKRRDYASALMVIEDCVKADDWRIVGTNWLLKRKAAYEARTSANEG